NRVAGARRDSHAIGLFYGMFESNIPTFNPGWAGLGEPNDEFTDVRQSSQSLRALSIEPVNDTTWPPQIPSDH
ncbi:MAG: hypothetical protein M3096_04800, partial [Actinomycetia bacterium]|nr:hypothetical protein [Actinomycetes bacterium]